MSGTSLSWKVCEAGSSAASSRVFRNPSEAGPNRYSKFLSHHYGDFFMISTSDSTCVCDFKRAILRSLFCHFWVSRLFSRKSLSSVRFSTLPLRISTSFFFSLTWFYSSTASSQNQIRPFCKSLTCLSFLSLNSFSSPFAHMSAISCWTFIMWFR